MVTNPPNEEFVDDTDENKVLFDPVSIGTPVDPMALLVGDPT